MGQVLLQNHKFTIMEGLYILAPVGAGCLITLAILLEGASIYRHSAWQIVNANLVQFLIVCFFGFAVNFLSFAVIQATSSLTCKIFNLARGVGMVFISIIFCGEVITHAQAVGYCF